MMRRSVLIVTIAAALCLGAGIGMGLYAWQGAAADGRSVVFPATPTVKIQVDPTPRPAPTPGAIGSTGRVATGGAGLLWVDEAGLSAWTRAFENRDDKAEAQVMRVFETLSLHAPTSVVVTNRIRDAVQVEITDGPYAGRRGWTRLADLRP